MDCWCCFPCFGICKKSKQDANVGCADEDPRPGMGEREPLLPKGPRQDIGSGSDPRYTSSAPNSATGTTLSNSSELGSDAFRDQVSEILFALDAGEVPSQDQITGFLRGVLSHGVFDVGVEPGSERSEDLDTSENAIGRNLLGDVQELVEAFLKFGVERNGDDKFQTIFFDFASLMTPPNRKPDGGRGNISSRPVEETPSELAFDTTTLLSALRTLVVASLASPSFRRILGQLGSIFGHHDDGNYHDPTLAKETIVVTIREIIDGIQSDRASRCAMRAILILVRKYAHIFSKSSSGTTTGETPLGSEMAVEAEIPAPAQALLKDIKEILERCSGGKALDDLLAAFVLVMSQIVVEDGNRTNGDQKDDDAAHVLQPIKERMDEKDVEAPEHGKQISQQLSPSTLVSAPTPVHTGDTTPEVAPSLPVQPPTPLSEALTSNDNGNGVGDNHTKKTSARNKKKKQKAKMKKKQKAMEKRAQEEQNESAHDPAALTSAQNDSEDEGNDAGMSNGTGPTTTDGPSSSPSDRQMTVSHQHLPSTSTRKPTVSLGAFLTRLGFFLDELLSETESENAHGSNPDTGAQEETSQRESSTAHSKVPNLEDLERLVDDTLNLFVDTAKPEGESQPPPAIHALLSEVRRFAQALENDQTLARLCRAVSTFRRDVHLSWGSEASSDAGQFVLKRLLCVLPWPLPLPLSRTSLPLPSRPKLGTTNLSQIELIMGNWEGKLTDLWVSENSNPRPSMSGGEGLRGRGRKWTLEGARVIEASLLKGCDLDVVDDRGHICDSAGDDNDNDDDETTILLSSNKAKDKTKFKGRNQSQSTTRTQRTYNTSNGTTRAASSSSDTHHSQRVPLAKSKVQRRMRLRMRIQVPLSNLLEQLRHHRLRAGIEDAHYRVRYTGPCSTWVGYEDQGVLDVEFGIGRDVTDGEIDIEIDVDLGFVEEEVIDTERVQDIQEVNNEGENKQNPTQKKLKSASTLSLFETVSPLSGSPLSPSSLERTPSHLSPVAQASTIMASEVDGKNSSDIPEIIVHEGSSGADFQVDIRNDDVAHYTRQQSVPITATEQSKWEGQRQTKSLKVLSTTVVPLDRSVLINQDDIEIDITRRESTSDHWPTTAVFMPPLGGSRGALVEQMVRLAVKSWVRGVMEDLVRDAVEQWLMRFLGGCQRVWEVVEKVFGGEDIW